MTEWLLFTRSFHGNDIIFVLTTTLEGREIAHIFLTEETDAWKTSYLPRLQPVDLQWHKEKSKQEARLNQVHSSATASIYKRMHLT